MAGKKAEKGKQAAMRPDQLLAGRVYLTPQGKPINIISILEGYAYYHPIGTGGAGALHKEPVGVLAEKLEQSVSCPCGSFAEEVIRVENKPAYRCSPHAREHFERMSSAYQSARRAHE